MSVNLRYDLIGATIKHNIKKHPQLQMVEVLGYGVIASIPCPIADCWIFTVEEIIEPLPGYLEIIE